LLLTNETHLRRRDNQGRRHLLESANIVIILLYVIQSRECELLPCTIDYIGGPSHTILHYTTLTWACTPHAFWYIGVPFLPHFHPILKEPIGHIGIAIHQ
jgi:hypothetical protein